MDNKQSYPIEKYKYDTLRQARAQKHQSNFREAEMQVPAVPNSKKSGCYGNVISAEDAATGVNFHAPLRGEILNDLNGKTGAILSDVLRSEHLPCNVFFPMHHDLKMQQHFSVR